MEETQTKKISRSIMTKNVTEFRHLIKNPHATEPDVTWAINLRTYTKSQGRLSKESITPEVYLKKTKLWEIRQQQFQKSKQSGCKNFKYNEYHHLVPNRNERNLKHSASAIQFFSSLRKGKNQTDKENQTPFYCIPHKDTHQKPMLLKKTMIKKTANITKDDLESAEDGRQNFPLYSEKILANKNYSLLKAFTSVRGRGKVSLPGLAWQVGLRNY